MITLSLLLDGSTSTIKGLVGLSQVHNNSICLEKLKSYKTQNSKEFHSKGNLNIDNSFTTYFL